MPRLSWENFTALAPRMSSEQRRAASVAGVAHALHDGYTDLIYIMLPLWQAEFGLTYAALGALRSMFVGAMALFANSRGLGVRAVRRAAHTRARHRARRRWLLFCRIETGFAMLLCALLISGIGASTQHPIASALVARAFAGPHSLKALGAYNFSGDLGKMTVPATLSLMLLGHGLASGTADAWLRRYRPCCGDLVRRSALRSAPAVRLRDSAKAEPEPKQQSVRFCAV